MATINNGEDDDDVVETRSRIDDLNDALIELIFTRLSPWKSLIMSKCVSKRWNSIISDPDFTRQLNPQSFPCTLVVVHGHNRECIITENSYFPKHKLPLDFIPTPHNFLTNTNDLVVAHHQINSQIEKYYVANPLTKQYIVVPQPDKPLTTWDYMFGIAGFVNGVSTINVSHRDNYNNNHGFRIVQVVGENLKSIVKIYSSETGQWKTYLFDCVDCPLEIQKTYLFDCVDCPLEIRRSAITWNNKIHWMKGSKLVVMDPFDLDNLVPRVLNLPAELGNNSSALISVCQNRLCIAQFEKTRLVVKNQRIKIWEIEDYDHVDDNLGSNYSVKVRLVIDFELNRLLLNRLFPASDGYDPLKFHHVVCCHPNDPQVVYFYYGGRLFYCNVVEQIYKKMGYCNLFSEAFVFVHPPSM